MDTKQRAVFLDRDGVLNHLVKRDGSYYSPQDFTDFKIIDDVDKVIEEIHLLGYMVIVVSNQPDISRGKLEQSELDKMTNKLYNDLKVDDVFYCTHDDDNDLGCRKPAPGLFYAVEEKHNIDLTKSFMIGDTWKDMEAAFNASIPFVLIDAEYNKNLESVNRIKYLQEAIPILKNGHF